MSNYKLTFKLKQHTPIIHFQHDQHGATLRASELKPKLDRFILKKFGKEELGEDKTSDEYYEEGIKIAKRKKWLIGRGEHPALNYKVQIDEAKDHSYYLPCPFLSNNKSRNLENYILNEMSINVSILAPSPYFSNADKYKFQSRSDKIDSGNTQLNELNFATFSESEIGGRITIFIPKLKEEIERYIVEFFLMQNFGTRQNKGFGSFTIKEMNNNPIKKTAVDEIVKVNYLIKSNGRQNHFNDIFKFILDEYQLLKSGKNHPVYKKSKMFEYFVDKNVRWEKRFIKRQINTKPIDRKKLFYQNHKPIDKENTSTTYYNDFEDKQNNDYKYIRALLGLTEHYEFLVDNGRGGTERNKYIVKIQHIYQNEKDKIERFKSPIFFKVIDNDVYLGINESYRDIEDEEFEFIVSYQDNSRISNRLGSLKVPPNFDLEAFINNKKSSNWKNI